jgi:hypothetical protein
VWVESANCTSRLGRISGSSETVDGVWACPQS